jgi:hypothetical protein
LERRYRFGPHPQAGWILGLRGSHVAGIVIAGVIALGLMRVGGLLSVALVGTDLALAVCIVGLRFAGHTALEWVPVVARFATARAAGTASFRSQAAHVGHLAPVPSHPDVEPQDTAAPVSLPAELSDLELLETPLARFGGVPMGVVFDRRAHTYTATVRCEARAFYLLGQEEREAMLAAYGALLTTFASDDSPVTRVAWYERTLPPGANELVEYLHEHRRPDLDGVGGESDRGLEATWQLLSAQGRGAEDHEVLVSLQIDADRLSAARAIAHLGGGRDGALALVAEQVAKLVDELTRIGVQAQQPIGARNPAVPSARGLAQILRNGIDPFARPEREHPPRGQEPGIAPESFGPRARESGWSHVRADGALHATGHLLEWPRSDVRATFLQGLLMGVQATRTVAMVMEVLGPRRATRQAERAAEEAAAEGWLRQRIGRRTTARDRAREHAISQRESELASGHALVKFAGFVTVSVPTEYGVGELNATFGRVQAASLASGLRLERMHGEQQEALTYTLPLCRGLL